jgi:hypothetical protein
VFPGPLQSTQLLVAQPRVDVELGHIPKVLGELPEEQVLPPSDRATPRLRLILEFDDSYCCSFMPAACSVAGEWTCIGNARCFEKRVNRSSSLGCWSGCEGLPKDSPLRDQVSCFSRRWALLRMPALEASSVPKLALMSSAAGYSLVT